ncbi:MAG: cold shock domain-containing protein [Leeuwenhoekiella sp.]
MAKSQQTFSKTEKEKKRIKKREEKAKKRAARKEEAKEKGPGDEFIYVNHLGQLVDTPPDPDQKVEVDEESIQIRTPKDSEIDKVKPDPIRKGKVSFFDHSKGFGFIIDNENNEKYFVHVSNLLHEIAEGNSVVYELERGQKGMNAVRVKKL